MEDRTDLRSHWERVYATKAPTELSWYEAHPTRSLELIHATGLSTTASIVDVGGGDSTLVDHLVASGYKSVTVLDLSAAALARARLRLGPRAELVSWREGNIVTADLAPASIDIWHDRAVFHFLTGLKDRAAYIDRVRRAVRPGGHVIVATFAEDGPTRCSGLPVERYSATALHATFGNAFRLVRSIRDVHQTPTGAEQRFTYCWCVYSAPAAAAA